MRIRDPGWEKFGSVIREKKIRIRDEKLRIRDKHPRSATLPPSLDSNVHMYVYTEGERGRYYRRDALGRVVPYKPVEHTIPGHLNGPYQGLMRYR